MILKLNGVWGIIWIGILPEAKFKTNTEKISKQSGINYGSRISVTAFVFKIKKKTDAITNNTNTHYTTLISLKYIMPIKFILVFNRQKVNMKYIFIKHFFNANALFATFSHNNNEKFIVTVRNLYWYVIHF